jgi:hypothetical protein
MGRARARSAQIGGPDCIAHLFQVSAYSSEPLTSKLARNLLSSDDWRRALADEPLKLGPEVSLVGSAGTVAGGAERLAGTRAGPDGPVTGPSGERQGQRPAADAGEKMALHIPPQVLGPYIGDRPRVHIARRQQAGRDQVAQPLRRERVPFAIIVHRSIQRHAQRTQGILDRLASAGQHDPRTVIVFVHAIETGLQSTLWTDR